MHDPSTLAFEFRLPWFRASRFPGGSIYNPRWKAGPTIWVIWHEDPQKGPGGDDSCGWSFVRPSEEEYSEVEKIAEFAWNEVWDEYTGVMRFPPESVALQLMTRMAWQIGFNEGIGKKELTPKDLLWIMHFASNPIDSCKNSFDGGAEDRYLHRAYGGNEFGDGSNPAIFPADGTPPLGDINKARKRFETIVAEESVVPTPKQVLELKKKFVSGAKCLWWVYRTEHRPWYKHPRWHLRHWKIQIPMLQLLRRWMFDKCEGCGKRLSGSVSAIGGWNAPYKGKHWWNSKKGLWHSSCHSAKCKADREAAEAEKGFPTKVEDIPYVKDGGTLFYDGGLKKDNK